MDNQAKDLTVNYDKDGNIILKIPETQKIIIKKPWHQTKTFMFEKIKYYFNIDSNTTTAKISIPGYTIRLWYEGDKVCADYKRVDSRLKSEYY